MFTLVCASLCLHSHKPFLGEGAFLPVFDHYSRDTDRKCSERKRGGMRCNKGPQQEPEMLQFYNMCLHMCLDSRYSMFLNSKIPIICIFNFHLWIPKDLNHHRTLTPDSYFPLRLAAHRSSWYMIFNKKKPVSVWCIRLTLLLLSSLSCSSSEWKSKSCWNFYLADEYTYYIPPPTRSCMHVYTQTRIHKLPNVPLWVVGTQSN